MPFHQRAGKRISGIVGEGTACDNFESRSVERSKCARPGREGAHLSIYHGGGLRPIDLTLALIEGWRVGDAFVGLRDWLKLAGKVTSQHIGQHLCAERCQLIMQSS